LTDNDAKPPKVAEQLRHGWKLRRLTNEEWSSPGLKGFSWVIFPREKVIFNDAKQFVGQILAEQVVVCIHMEKGQWCGSCWLPPDKLQHSAKNIPVLLYTLVRGLELMTKSITETSFAYRT